MGVPSTCGKMSEILHIRLLLFFFFQAEDGIRDLVRSRGLGDVYKRQSLDIANDLHDGPVALLEAVLLHIDDIGSTTGDELSLIHI